MRSPNFVVSSSLLLNLEIILKNKMFDEASRINKDIFSSNFYNVICNSKKFKPFNTRSVSQTAKISKRNEVAKKCLKIRTYLECD